MDSLEDIRYTLLAKFNYKEKYKDFLNDVIFYNYNVFKYCKSISRLYGNRKI